MTHTPTRVWYGTMPVEFLYTPGAAGLRFFQTLREKGVLSATHCAECTVTYLPPRVYCENCFADLSDAWREVGSTGRVHTFTVVHVDREGRRLDPPQVIAFVRVDGTDGGLVARLVDVTPSDVRLEMPVELVLQPARKRRALPADIIGFSPARPPQAPASRRGRRR
ncbi:MAG TPA: Zn-ribbon domain-containing OB-fold protein [bacterium]